MASYRPNYRIYALGSGPPPPNEPVPDFMSLNTQFLLKVETKLKLNLIDKDQNSMVSSEDRGNIETHFVLVEGVMERFSMGTGVIR